MHVPAAVICLNVLDRPAPPSQAIALWQVMKNLMFMLRWKQCRAGLDYHVDIGRHYYSVPHQLLKQKLWARITARTVEVYFKGQRVASHARTSGNRQHSTHRDHMPAHHRFREDWTPERIRRQAVLIGPNVETFVDVIMRQRRHPEQGYRSCLQCGGRVGPGTRVWLICVPWRSSAHCDWPRPSGAIAWMLLVVVPWRSGTLRDWAHRYNAEGVSGLFNRARPLEIWFQDEARVGQQGTLLHIAAFHSQEWSRSQTSHPRHGRACDHPPQYPWRGLLPLKRTRHA